ncbi:MAG: hypothetical protein ACRELB_00095, partial [Polyangiaceae bacterium]
MRFGGRMLRLGALAAISLVAGLAGCGGTSLRVTGYPEADVYVALPPGTQDLVLVGRTSGVGEFSLEYRLPDALVGKKLRVRVVSGPNAWEV